MKKLYLALCAALTLLYASCASASAAPLTLALAGPGRDVAPGERVTVAASLTENPGAMAMTLYAEYDPAVLTLVEVSFPEDGFARWQKTGPSLDAANAAGRAALQWDAGEPEACRETGEIALMTFLINEGAPDSDVAVALSAGADGGAYGADGEAMDVAGASLALAVRADAGAGEYRFNDSDTAYYANLRLIEPWGLRVAAQLTDARGDSADAVALYEAGRLLDFGFFFLKDTGAAPDTASLAENGAAIRASYANRASRSRHDMGYYDGADGAENYFSCVFSGFYTYQLGLRFHFAAYAQLSDGRYVYAPVRSYDMRTLISSFAGRTAVPLGERTLLRELLEMYDAVKAYYAEYESGRYYAEYIGAWR